MSSRGLALAVFGVGWLCSVEAFEARAQTESATSAARYGYLPEWPPGPPASSVPDWAQPGRIRFSRWDGGPIETAKAMLSGWAGFNPPIPDYLYVMTNWYQPSTIRFLRSANVNLVWVTFSNGFSIPSEKVQRKLLRPYIDQCHRQGIHVMAYESVANLFWEDMFEHVPASKNWVSLAADGKPVPYGAGDYTKMGRVTRYMADLANPQWRNYLKQRIDLAIEAGADGVMYDNCASLRLAEVFQDLMPYALGRKKDFLLMVNFHRHDFILNRLVNAITTEEGGEAGIFSEKTLAAARYRWPSERGTMLPVEGGYLANNIGRFRIFENLSEGWKPVMIESRVREVGIPETHVMSARRHQLVMAENMMFSIANELFIEGRFADGLWNAEPEIMGTWKAIGQYNRFFAENEKYYRAARSVASLAIVLDNRSEGEVILNGLAGRNVLYHVLYEHELTPAKLRPYAAVALLTADMVRSGAMAALDAYVAEGGKLFAAAQAARQDENGRRRQRPAWFGQKHGKGLAVCWERIPPIDELAAALCAADRPPAVRIEAPAGVLYNVTRQPQTGRLLVHLTNYLPRPVGKVVVAVPGKYQAVALLTPDGPCDPPRAVARADGTEIEIPQLQIYSLLVLSGERTSAGVAERSPPRRQPIAARLGGVIVEAQPPAQKIDPQLALVDHRRLFPGHHDQLHRSAMSVRGRGHDRQGIRLLRQRLRIDRDGVHGRLHHHAVGCGSIARPNSTSGLPTPSWNSFAPTGRRSPRTTSPPSRGTGCWCPDRPGALCWADC